MQTKTTDTDFYFGIEAGGTKFNCVVGDQYGSIIERKRIPTQEPECTLHQVELFFDECLNQYPSPRAMGIACFGPLDIDETSANYGSITETPKPLWSNINVLDYFKKHYSFPIAFDTDVNGAAYGEYRFGCAKGLSDFIYVTIGTGIGGGIFANSKLIRGAVHPEIGHMFIAEQEQNQGQSKGCPFHTNCLSAYASGPAMEQYWGKKAERLPPDHKAWDREAYYLALMCANLVMCYSPKKIILGGGVMQQEGLLKKIHAKLPKVLNGYMFPNIPLDEFIVKPGLNTHSGEVGSIAMAIDLVKNV